MADKSNLYKFKQLEAISNTLVQNEPYFYRKMCRWFSKEFHTPLIDVYQLPYDFVLTNYYETSLENMSHNEVFDLAQNDFIEEFMDKREDEDKAFAESLKKEQEETIRKKKAKEGKKSQSLKEDAVEGFDGQPDKPKSIEMNFEDPEEI